MKTCDSDTCCAPASTTAPAAAAATAATPLIRPSYRSQSGAEGYTVEVDLPGVRKDAVSLQLEDNTLTIRGDRATALPEGWKVVHRELPTGGYELRLRVNAPVDETRLTASLADGVLTVRLPLRETARPRRIEVN